MHYTQLYYNTGGEHVERSVNTIYVKSAIASGRSWVISQIGHLETLYSALVLSLLLQTDRFLVDFCTTKRYVSVAWQKVDSIGLKTFPAGLASGSDHPNEGGLYHQQEQLTCVVSHRYTLIKKYICALISYIQTGQFVPTFARISWRKRNSWRWIESTVGSY